MSCSLWGGFPGSNFVFWGLTGSGLQTRLQPRDRRVAKAALLVERKYSGLDHGFTFLLWWRHHLSRAVDATTPPICRASSRPRTAPAFHPSPSWESWLGAELGAGAEGCRVQAPVSPQPAQLPPGAFGEQPPVLGPALRGDGGSFSPGWVSARRSHGSALCEPVPPLSRPVSHPCRPWCKMPSDRYRALVTESRHENTNL